jgi:hypothetical protein
MNRYDDPDIDDPLRPAKGLFWNTIVAAIIWAFVIWLLYGCGQGRPAHPTLEFKGSAAQTWYSGPAPAFNGASAIENSLVYVGTNIFAVFTTGGSGDMYEANLGPNGDDFHSIYTGNLPRVAYPYTLQVGNVYYTFAQIHGGKDILLWSSADAIHWTIENGGLPVLTASDDPNSIWFMLWNVGVTVDDQGTWHLLAECATQGGETNLCYASSPDEFHFDDGKQNTVAIPHGGNPWLQFLPGKGLLAIHGQAGIPDLYGPVWYTTASTLPIGATIWTTHTDKFTIGATGYHICDPAALQMKGGRIMMTVSNDQAWIDIVYSSNSLEDFWNKLTL